jgi:6-phosphogluconolactonase
MGGLVVVEDAATLAREAAERVAACARAAVAARGRFALALSGGSTPRALFQQLATPPLRDELPWSRTEVFWADERCVPPDHTDSNYGMARAALLDPAGVPAERIHRIRGELDPGAAASAYEAELARVLGGAPGGPAPALDLVLLGMGADGHTASLFPGTAALAERRRWVAANDIARLGTHRITLTFPLLNQAAHAWFLVAGADKAAVLREVLEGPVDPTRLPAQGVRPEAGELVWLVDRAAAGQLASSGAAPRRSA